ncbi:hypothetical protein AGMMS50267_16650 [Spirochaetia bacterium]|nr:hypothetical protein AGMMS50267_16650 [Spirochaetia bacterium]
MSITNTDFISGALPLDSYVRPNKLFTAQKSLILSSIGCLSDSKIAEIINAVITIVG